jgi:apolipoprotein N-acyltransferase
MPPSVSSAPASASSQSRTRWFSPQAPQKYPAAFRLLVSAIAGAGLALSFTWLYFPLYAWASVGVLLMMTLSARPRVAYFCGHLHALAFVVCSVPWIAEVLAVHGGMSRLAGWGVLLLIATAWGVLTGSFAWCVNRIAQGSLTLACLAAPFFWVTFEFVRAHLPEISFPWNLLGYSAGQNPALLQLAALAGVYGLSFLMAAFNALLAWADAAKTLSFAKRFVPIAVSIVILLLVAYVGERFVPSATPNHYSRAVQPMFPEVESYVPNWFDVHAGDLEDLTELSLANSSHKPDLIIWPEAPAPFSWQDNQFSKRASALAIQAGHPFLTGVIEWKQEKQPNGHIGEAPYNSAILVDPQGQRVFSYDKRHLVPFGEYEPFPLIHRVVQSVSDEVGGFRKGTTATIGALPGGFKFGTYICYEAIYPGEVREFAAKGANLLINISNDGWFGKSAAAEQHLRMARVRAVENRRWVLRVTNSGLTASIDPYGRIYQTMPRDMRGAVDLPYDFRTDTTLYTRAGDWFAWMCVGVSVILFLNTFRKTTTKT